MIKKFKNFDADGFINKKKALKEALGGDIKDTVMESPEIDPDVNVDEIITGTPVYENPYLLKISNIVGKKLKSSGLGDFGVSYNVVYLNDIPGVRFFEKGGNRSIVCCRSTNEKSISIFNNFEVGKENVAIVTYSTKKLGFKDMIDQLIDDLKGDTVNEGVINEAADRYGSGWTVK